MALKDLRDELPAQMQENIRAGARHPRRNHPDKPGKHVFYEPTILTGIKKYMPAYSEEIFGPYACIITLKDAAEAIHSANDTSFGLGGDIYHRHCPG